MPPRRLAALLAMLVMALFGAPPAGAIVGGSQVAIADHPYQVALITHGASDGFHGQYCGGTVFDTTHIITAAHCVYDTPDSAVGQPVAPAAVDVLAGTADLNDPGATIASVRAVSFDPRFDTATMEFDAAVVTLTDALPSDPDIAAIPIASPVPAAFPPGASAFVTGWGATDTAGTSFQTRLRGATVPLEGDSACGAQYRDFPSPLNGALMVCAGDGGNDSCFGDSGGPLVQPVGPPWTGQELIGIVSFGPQTCADATHAGVYTEAPADAVRSFVTRADPGDAPRVTSLPSVNGTPTAGETLTCSSGTWSGSATTQTTQWVRGSGTSEQAVTAPGSADTYAATDGDVGSPLRCVVKASRADGYSVARSPLSANVAARAVQPQPQPTPAPVPAPPPTAPQDKAAPVARVLTARCVKLTCTLTLNVTDSGFSAGIAKVTGSLRSTYRRSCVKNGRRTTCARHRSRTFTARRTAATRFTVKLTKLPVGTQLFTLLATDKAGHKQLLPTRRTLKTTRR